jgi:N-methylhydantoinase B
MNASELAIAVGSLRGIAEEMGAALVRSALSPNIKERRDCSTALFDGRGNLVIQAEHVPVHLGAMPASVMAVLEREPAAQDVWCLNDPFAGGSHLPDITLVSPLDVDGVRVGFAASRAHHADVGGMAPASMPADSSDLQQEGLVIPPIRLMANGHLDQDLLHLISANSRVPAERLGDLRAQLAVHELAQRRIGELCIRNGRDWLESAQRNVQEYSERRTRAAIEQMPDGRFAATETIEALEGDLEIHASVTIAGDQLRIDFAGTSAQHHGNLNCPIAVTKAASYFVVRILTDPDGPASGGALAPVHVTAPEGTLLNPRPPCAVVAGNVETSSRIADCLLRAFSQAVETPAQGQGTMNNLTLGNSRFTYYETIGGGQGATCAGPGPSGVHVAMSNTLNTPIEALEVAYPLRVERYALRRGSGGRGLHRGGEGVIRSIRALESCDVSVLSDRRRHHPNGTRGGGPGALGRNTINARNVGAKVRTSLMEGDVVTIVTPGGGSFGAS